MFVVCLLFAVCRLSWFVCCLSIACGLSFVPMFRSLSAVCSLSCVVGYLFLGVCSLLFVLCVFVVCGCFFIVRCRLMFLVVWRSLMVAGNCLLSAACWLPFVAGCL